MRSILLLAFCIVFAEEKYRVARNETEIRWSGAKITGQGHYGTVEVIDGFLVLSDGIIKSGEFTVDLDTIQVLDIKDEKNNLKLKNHLKSDDFFSVDTYRYSKLKITGSERLEDGKHRINGDLEIKGVLKPISFIADIESSSEKIVGRANITLDRTEWGVRYGSGKFFKNLGDKLINDAINIQVKLLAYRENPNI